MELLIFVGHCPVCESGLCRVRVVGVAKRELRPVIVCDECEAAWGDIARTNRIRTSTDDAEKANSTEGVGRAPNDTSAMDGLWDEPNRWATVEDVCLMGIYSQVQIDRI